MFLAFKAVATLELPSATSWLYAASYDKQKQQGQQERERESKGLGQMGKVQQRMGRHT